MNRDTSEGTGGVNARRRSSRCGKKHMTESPDVDERARWPPRPRTYRHTIVREGDRRGLS